MFNLIDSLDITYADSFTWKYLKINEHRVHRDGKPAKKGTGEKRLYCGHDEDELNAFFEFDKDPIFFIQKDDLIDYCAKIKDEYMHPSYHYGDGEKASLALFKKYTKKLKELNEDRLYLKFTYTYDRQNRYYLVLPRRSKATALYHQNYSYLHEVCLPRVTRLMFVKLFDSDNGQINFYIKPVYNPCADGQQNSKPFTSKKKENDKENEADAKYRKYQNKYREAVFQKYPYCVVTKVTDPSLLEACHIKSYAKRNRSEQNDSYNGFSMPPTIHTLFDLGYITFDKNGKMILSDFFRNMDRRSLHLDGTIRIQLYPEALEYIKWHNNNIFIKTSTGVDIEE
ncbi:MAG: HNH endonuclease [Muribaculaceae bacterium]|nr:HNH endonuclease [Muribaculaceae bacterium]